MTDRNAKFTGGNLNLLTAWKKEVAEEKTFLGFFDWCEIKASILLMPRFQIDTDTKDSTNRILDACDRADSVLKKIESIVNA